MLKCDIYSSELRCGCHIMRRQIYWKLYTTWHNEHFAECVTANYVRSIFTRRLGQNWSANFTNSKWTTLGKSLNFFFLRGMEEKKFSVGFVWGNQLMNCWIDEMYRCAVVKKVANILIRLESGDIGSVGRRCESNINHDDHSLFIISSSLYLINREKGNNVITKSFIALLVEFNKLNIWSENVYAPGKCFDEDDKFRVDLTCWWFVMVWCVENIKTKRIWPFFVN